MKLNGSKLYFHGGKGDHAKDLMDRGIVNGSNIKLLDIGNSDNLSDGNHIVSVPISFTSQLIRKILALGGDTQIVNLSGLMNTNSGLSGQNEIANIHCLFGFGTKEENLNAVVTEVKNDISLSVESALREKGVKIHSLSPDEHDKKMAVIQALTHLCEIYMGMFFYKNGDVRNVIREWKTKDNTISDMMTYNPFFTEIKEQFSSKVLAGEDLNQVFIDLVESYLKEGDVGKYGSINFYRILKFFRKQKSSGLVISEDIICEVQNFFALDYFKDNVNMARFNVNHLLN
ncbi:MAG: hypothetical protein PHN31_03285 [Candidatus Gracilibacteria bacterium]|nr:hypothetical protein [Candidatus Gracilibacteria bacterium]